MRYPFRSDAVTFRRRNYDYTLFLSTVFCGPRIDVTCGDVLHEAFLGVLLLGQFLMARSQCCMGKGHLYNERKRVICIVEGWSPRVYHVCDVQRRLGVLYVVSNYDGSRWPGNGYHGASEWVSVMTWWTVEENLASHILQSLLALLL